MKKSVTLAFLMLSLFFLTGANFSIGVKKSGFFDFLETVDLTSSQRQKIDNIRKEENFTLEPLMLDYQSKERGIKFLKGLRCDIFDYNCKYKLRMEIADFEHQKEETERQILQKKNYYRIRYRNVLTREQDLKIKSLIEKDELQKTVKKERNKRQKRKERIEKLKFWNKFKRK